MRNIFAQEMTLDEKINDKKMELIIIDRHGPNGFAALISLCVKFFVYSEWL